MSHKRRLGSIEQFSILKAQICFTSDQNICIFTNKLNCPREIVLLYTHVLFGPAVFLLFVSLVHQSQVFFYSDVWAFPRLKQH